MACGAVMGFDFALGAAKMHGGFCGKFAVGICERGQFFDDVGGVAREQVVFEREEKLCAAGLALTRGATDELAINTRGFVTFEADDVEAADAFACCGERDVRAAPGHVGGDGDGAGFAGLGDDFSFVGVLLGVEQAEGKFTE